ncbi:MAG: hypothetical protein HY286_16460 [Planctomycetes bacterium]|nr:hypothetical protein [Planctomycetota bacterium]
MNVPTRFVMILASIAAAACAMGASAFAAPSVNLQNQPNQDLEAPRTGVVGAQTVTFDVKDRDINDIIDFIRRRTDMNIVVAPGITDKITLSLKDVDWRKALDLVAERAGCVVVSVSTNVVKIEKPPRVHIAFQNVDIREVIDVIAKIGSANVIVAPEVKGSINIRLRDQPWRDALDAVVKTLGYSVVEEERGILRVVAREALKEQLETRAFQLKYLRPNGIYHPKIKTEYTVGEPKISQDPVKEFRLLEALKKSLSKDGKIDYIDRKNAIIITDIPPVVKEIEKLLLSVDTEPRQVFIDVKFVSTVNSDIFDFGIDYGSQGPIVTASGGQIPIEVPFQLGSGGFEDNFIVSNHQNVGPFPSGNPGNTIVPDTIFGALSFTQVSAALRLLKRDIHSEIQQSPRIICLDNYTSTIFVGEQVPYAQARTEQGQSGGLQLSIEEADKSPVSTGFQLFVTPHLIPETNRIVLEIIPNQQSLSGSSGPPAAPAGFEVFTVGGSGQIGSIALPRLASSTIATTMLLESGQTAAIGGLTTDSKSEAITKLPLLGDIPFLGWLFKTTATFNDRRTLIVLVTPTIVQTAAETADTIARSLDDQQKRLQNEVNSIFGSNDTNPAKPSEAAAQKK